MASRKRNGINIAFNLFAYTVVEHGDIEQLDHLVRGKIKAKDPYKGLESVSQESLAEYRRFFGPVAKAIGVPLDAMGRTHVETMRDLSRRVSTMDGEDTLIGAKMSFDWGSIGKGEVVCIFAGASGQRMALKFGVDTSRTRGRWINSATAVFSTDKTVAEFELKVKGMQEHYECVLRQFANYDRFEEALAVFGKGYRGVAEHLVERYRELGSKWTEQEVTPAVAIRQAVFDDEVYAAVFDDDEQKVTISTIWCGTFRFDATYAYTDFMELDLATICDVEGYEKAVTERTSLEARERSLGALDEASWKTRALADNVEDLTSARPQSRPVERVHVSDLVVRARTSTCGFEKHEIREVIALVNVFDPKRGVVEVAVDAFCCPTCRRYYVLEKNFDRVARRGSLCCRVIVRPGQVQEFIPSNHKELAEKSLFRQLGYSVGKEEGLSDGERRAILDFAIENGFKTQKQTVSFLEWLIRFNGGQKNMRQAVRKWESDIKYLISDKSGRANHVKIDRVFLTKHKWGQ